MNYSSEGVAEIEQALESARPGRWRRVTGKEFNRGESAFAIAGWRVDFPRDMTRLGSVSHFLVFMDAAFPYSELRVVIPDMAGVEWPHLEEKELLCLPATSPGESIAARVETVLEDAQLLLNWDADRCRSEFGREIQAYWRRKVTSNLQLYSLADPEGPTRQCVYCSLPDDSILVADREDDAHQWLLHARGIKDHGRLHKTLIIRLPGALLPSEFPANGSALIYLAGQAVLEPFMALNRTLPILLAFRTEGGQGFVGLTIHSPTRGGKVNGFRPGKGPPLRRGSFPSMPTQLCNVERVDRAWAFGRDHGAEVRVLEEKRVAVIGCGAIGGSMSISLAQAGVGRMWFVDGDILHAHNPARHVLSSRYINWSKAGATATEVRRHAPTMIEAVGFPRRFEALTPDELCKLAGFDLIVCAGLDRRGEVHFDRWRRALERPPAVVCTFAEEFALVGHAIALLGDDALSLRYDKQGNFDFLATEWLAQATTIREAGCGNDFQPFGMVDLMPTIQMASQLALEVVSGKVSSSTRRTWFGNRQRVADLGGKATATFTGSECIHDYPWAVE